MTGVGEKWRQLYFNNNKKTLKKKSLPEFTEKQNTGHTFKFAIQINNKYLH